jgi:deoxycytidylate deaminase
MKLKRQCLREKIDIGTSMKAVLGLKSLSEWMMLIEAFIGLIMGLMFNTDSLITKKAQMHTTQVLMVSSLSINITHSPFNIDYDFLNRNLLRPEWDTYFMRLAEVAATRSNCMKRHVGAIIVSDNRIVSTGYNGTPFYSLNCNEGGCKRCNSNAHSGSGLDECLCIHAEENAVIEAGRRNAMGATIYCTTYPCLLCAKSLV